MNHSMINEKLGVRPAEQGSAGATGTNNSSKWSSSSSSDDSEVSDPEVCRYFARGMCRFGEMCRFAHILGENVWAANLYTPTSSSQTRRSVASSTNSTVTTAPSNVAPSSAPITSISSPSSTDVDSNTFPTSAKPKTKSPQIVPSDPSSWVLAPVFVPNKQQSVLPPATTMSYAQVVGDSGGEGVMVEVVADIPIASTEDLQRISGGHSVLCPYLADGRVFERPDGAGPPMCRYGAQCVYDHGELCDMCSRWCLHPTDEAQRKDHQTECMMQHEANMELSFAVARSRDKTCGICFEVIMEKTGREQRFGILPNCNHIFCLQCIRKWRLAKQFDNKIIRACPECRVTSDFVCPSAFWVDTKEEKEKLLGDYRGALNQKDCKYFKKGNGKCPFGNKCFYKHALDNGQLVDVGVPQRAARRQNHMGEVDALQFFLWDFMDDRDHQWLDEMAVLLSDDDDDDDPVLDLVERMFTRSNHRH